MITVYFRHRTRTPNNVRAVWHHALVVPRVGESILITHGLGSHERWQVVRVEIYNGGQSATVDVVDEPELAAGGGS